MKKFFNGLLIFILLIVIIGGIGYIGYNYYFINPAQLQNGSIYNQQTTQTPANNSMAGMPGMQHGNANNQQPANNAATGGTPAAETAALALKNRDVVNQALSSLNEAIESMSLDPYGSSNNTQEEDSMANMPGMNNTPAMAESNQSVTNPGTSTTIPSVQGNTTINIYPQQNGGQTVPASNTTQNGMMPNMGTTYDPNKMEQLHSGLFKLSLGMQLLEQLKGEFAYQAESAASNIQDLAQYYSLQYTTALQNKSKLSQASIYINEAANLLNINPYISGNGMVFDQERMQQIHKSVFKLADGIAALSRLDGDLTKQAVAAANTSQTYVNAANTAQMNNMMPATNGFDNILGGLNIHFIVNVILVIFVIAFILGILGSVFSLLKAPAKSQGRI
ncbi:MAG TPA: hypothetical protein VEG39_20205 [Clostridia bacterium]|nr:hypothetical protein [Clostridia bacterium]